LSRQLPKRERALADAREHLLSLSKANAREQATNQAQERRIADLETEIAQYRQQTGALTAGATAEKQTAQRRRAPGTVNAAPRAASTARPKKPVQPKPAVRRKAAAASRASRRQPIKAARKAPSRKQR